MKSVNFYNLSILLVLTLLLYVPKLVAQEDKPGLINRLGINIGVNFPVGSEVLRKGAYPIGLSLYLTATHITSNRHNFELLAGADIIADYGGGIYLAMPGLVNWSYELIYIGNKRFIISNYAGLGYTFHHIYTRTEGIIVKNQHALGLDAGLIFNYALGKNWGVNLRTGVFHSFTSPVQAYYAGTSVTSENKFNYTTFLLLIGFSRKIGKL